MCPTRGTSKLVYTRKTQLHIIVKQAKPSEHSTHGTTLSTRVLLSYKPFDLNASLYIYGSKKESNFYQYPCRTTLGTRVLLSYKSFDLNASLYIYLYLYLYCACVQRKRIKFLLILVHYNFIALDDYNIFSCVNHDHLICMISVTKSCFVSCIETCKTDSKKQFKASEDGTPGQVMIL